MGVDKMKELWKKSKGLTCLLIFSVSLIPTLIIGFFILSNENIRIVDPMIGNPACSEPNNTVYVSIKVNAPSFLTEWNVQFIHTDFSWYSVGGVMMTRPTFSNGVYRIGIGLPETIEYGLYDIKLSFKVWGREKTIIEPHALYIFNRTEISTRIRFIHITDSHVNYQNKEVDTNVAHPHQEANYTAIPIIKNLESTIKEINIIRPDFVLFTGDISDTGREFEFQEIRRILQTSKVPIFTTLGNHEYRSPPSYEYYLAPRYFSRQIGNWRIILLDTGATEGNGLIGEQLQWYKSELIEAKGIGQQVIVGMHAPSATEQIGGYVIAGNQEFRTLNEEYNVRAVFAGHHHVFDAKYHNGTQISTNDIILSDIRPLYIVTDSSTISYGLGDYQYMGWRYVESYSDGNISFGYDMDNDGIAELIRGFPRFGFTLTENATGFSLQNYYLHEFSEITFIKIFEKSQIIGNLGISNGYIVKIVEGIESIGVKIKIHINKNSTEYIQFLGVI
jgi:hypothetical protein